jgi:NDP-sugar pyrophosphorylase family protein
MSPQSPPDLSPWAFFDLGSAPLPTAILELFEVEHAWQALGARFEAWLAANLRPGIEGQVSDGAWIVGGDIQIGEGSVIEPGAYVKGPCIIGRNVEVRHGAYIRGNVFVGDGCVIGHATEVKGSIFLPGAKAGHFAYVGDSMLGRDVNLGAGTKLANLRLRGDEVFVTGGGMRVPTGLRKFGAILGDSVQTGCNSVTNPGTMLGPGCRLLPCAVASGHHPAETLVGRSGR